MITIRSFVDPFAVGANAIVTMCIPPGPIVIPSPPPVSVRIVLCLGDVTLVVRIPVPVLVIVMLPDAVAPGVARKFRVFRLTEMCPGPDGVGVGVAVGVVVAVAVGVVVAVGVGVADGVGVAVALGVATASGCAYSSTRLF